jgi:hypothetical protein
MKTTVVGYDRTPPSEGALAVANRESFWRGASLIVVTAYHGLTFPGQQSPDPADPEATARPRSRPCSTARTACANCIRESRSRHAPRLDTPARSSPRRAMAPTCLAVGNRGGGGFQGLLPGSDPWPPRRPPANRL